jgi:RNA polymerase sigma factor (sigma-70 family)
VRHLREDRALSIFDPRKARVDCESITPCRFADPTTAELKECWDRWRAGDSLARHELIERCLPLTNLAAQNCRYAYRCLGRSDFYGEAQVALVDAVSRYDETREMNIRSFFTSRITFAVQTAARRAIRRSRAPRPEIVLDLQARQDRLKHDLLDVDYRDELDYVRSCLAKQSEPDQLILTLYYGLGGAVRCNRTALASKLECHHMTGYHRVRLAVSRLRVRCIKDVVLYRRPRGTNSKPCRVKTA